jgi:hypothetical protein
MHGAEIHFRAVAGVRVVVRVRSVATIFRSGWDESNGPRIAWGENGLSESVRV